MGDGRRSPESAFFVPTPRGLRGGGRPTDPGEVDAATFRSMVGESFDTICGEGDCLPLVLQKVSERAALQGMACRSRLSLLFLGPGDRVLPQGVYRLSHQTLGVLRLSIVPRGTGRNRRITYQAAFA